MARDPVTPDPSARKRVLVVDDYPDAAKILCTLLELLGHDTTAACCGNDAVTCAGANTFDIAIIDIGLPDISGLEVARAIRDLPCGPTIYLVAMSGWGQPQDRIRSVEAGFDQHVMKPLDGRILQRILELARARAS
jgi:CheY-like chemotaxis protein